MDELDKRIKSYYDGKSLSSDQIQQLTGGSKKLSSLKMSRIMAYAASFLLLFTATFYFTNKASEKNRIQTSYAAEVVFNHKKDLQSDIQSSDVSVLNQEMEKLNFDLYLPKNVQGDYHLLGGRYCSIDDRMAAQLKLAHKETAEVATLYVLAKEKKEKYSTELEVDDTSVTMWNDKSNLFVLAD